MFEQESYDRATAPTVSQPGELFYNYEIKSWFFTPALYKMLAIAAVLNLAFLAVVSQTNVLTARGCDSPWVGRVCQVVDMAYLGAMLYGTEREYVDEVYEKTDLGEADITYIDVTGEAPPLSYPEGYFQVANPVQFAMLQQQAANGANGVNGMPGTYPQGFTSVPNNDADLLKQRANPPAPNPNAFSDDTSTSELFKVEDKAPSTGIPNRKRGGGRLPSQPKKDDLVAQQDVKPEPKPTPTVEPTGPVDGVKINRDVMKDFGKSVAEKLDSKQVDLGKNFKVTALATLLEDGKFDITIDPKTKEKKSRVLTGEGDPEMVKVVTEAIAAIGDSGWLGYLSIEGIKNITFTFEQNDQELTANIVSEQLSPKRAEMLSKALTNGITLAFALGTVKGEDEKTLLKAATATADGKKVVIKFTFPKATAQEIIQRNIQKAREAETGVKINGQVQDIGSNDARLSR